MAIVKALLIEDDPGDAFLLEEVLEESTDCNVSLQWERRLASGIHYLKENPVDIVILDLSLPDATGRDAFLRLNAFTDHIPVIILTGRRDEQLAFELLTDGAQDYILKEFLSAKMFSRVMLYSISRYSMQREIRSSEERFRQIFTHSRDGILLLDDKKHILALNPVAAKLFSKCPDFGVGSEFDYPFLVNSMGEFQLSCADGNERELQIYAGELEWQDKLGYLITIYDVTAQRLAEEAQKYAHALKTVKELAGAMSHEFSQPIQVLSGVLELQKDENIDAENIEVGERMIKRMTELVVDLRNITVLERQKYLQSEIIDIRKSNKRRTHRTSNS